ncbi:MAG TPA: adenylate/guanylate cyclase domain-containing protein, partial [Anaerolineales bacterium]|nr:adenylate/guanylate cyclase domain-containing protein [Anaerolineales bacterium]
MTSCPNCQASNRPGAFFCKDCGQRLACPRCLAILSGPANFCDNCGQALAAAPPQEGQTIIASSSGRPDLADRGVADSPLSGPGLGALSNKNRSPSTPSQPSLDRFLPKELQANLEAARASGTMVGERRVVTMLFCDVYESTRAAENLDPEEWTEIINGAFEHMIRPVYKYEGTVARLMGDSILAFFGAPIAHEDDPQRAVLAALEIVSGIKTYQERNREGFGVEISVRVGVNTGEVVVGAVGSDLRMEYSAMGDAINVAARMEQSASPGTVLVAHETYRLVAPLFDFESLGDLEVKGRSAPVAAYRVIDRKAAPGRVRGIEGLDTPMIGRSAEAELLNEAVRALQKGVGGIVFIVGEAGLGKSRLIREVYLGLEGVNGASMTWYETASLSYEIAQPYSLFQRLIKKSAGIQESDPPETVREKLGELASSSPETGREMTTKAFESLFGLSGSDGRPPLQGESFKSQLYNATEDYLRQQSSSVPITLVLDDLHWTDPASIALIEHLYPLTEEVPILFICALRPDWEANGWDLYQRTAVFYPHRTIVIEIPPLTPEEGNLLVDSLLAISDLPDPLRQNILTKADGNPFFVEEVVRTLIETGVVRRDGDGAHWVAAGDGSQIDIPDNLQTLLITRIDRLDAEARDVLQLASLIGRSFYYRILERVVSSIASAVESDGGQEVLPLRKRLTSLQRADLIRESARIPELEYVFRHALTQEAAYGTILHRLRRSYHLTVGEAIEEIFSEGLANHAAALAWHFDEGGEPAKAAQYHIMAGDASFRLYSLPEAIDHYDRALALLDPSDAGSGQLVHLFKQRGRALEVSDDYHAALENYSEMSRLADQRSDASLRLGSLVARATIHSIFSPVYNADLGQALAEEALQLARNVEDYESEARALWCLMLVHTASRGDFPTGRGYGEAALSLVREYQLKEQMGTILNDYGRLLGLVGYLTEGLGHLREAKPLFEESGNLPLLQDNFSNLALLEWLGGNLEASKEASEEGLRLSESIDNQWGYRVNTSFHALAIGEGGELGLSISVFEAIKPSINPSQLTAFCNFTGLYYDEAGLAALILPEYERLSANLAGSTSMIRPGFFCQLARIYVSQGDFESAEVILRDLSLSPEMEPLLAISAIGFLATAEISLARGQAEDAIPMLKKVRTRQERAGLYWLLG